MISNKKPCMNGMQKHTQPYKHMAISALSTCNTLTTNKISQLCQNTECKVPKTVHDKKQIYPWIDVCKGIGIILVVLGHCIFPFVQIIDYFHMPLFFLLAGLTFSPKNHHDFILTKINRIFVPYVFFSIISAIISFVPHGFGGPFNGPLWFLQNIFVALIIVHIATLLSPRYSHGFMAIVLISSYFLSLHQQVRLVLPFGLSLGCLSAVFIYIGYVLKKAVLTQKRKWFDLISAISFGILFLICAIYAKVSGLQGGYVSWSLFHSNYLQAFVLAILGSSAIIYISKLIGKNKWLEYLGHNSLCIMSVHFPLAMYLDGTLVKLPFFNSMVNKFIVAFGEWCIVLAFSILMCHLCKAYIPNLTGYKALIK